MTQDAPRVIAKKKLIEVALPLDAINKASAREKSIRHGHPSTLHLWWARRPLAAARAVIFAQMVDDPSANPDLFPTEKAQEKERQRLFKIIEDLVLWENTTNEVVLQRAREEIWQSWRRACAENADHPRAKDLFDRNVLPAFHDPFAGGGSLPLEAQRLGLEAYASDLNPVAVLINKAMIEIPPKFAGKPPVNPKARGESRLMSQTWRGAQGLAEDVRYYGQWMRDEAEKRIGHLYPKVRVTAEMARERPDLEPYVGRELTVIAWLWARTVKSPNPAFRHVDVPLVTSFMLSAKPGKEAYVQPVIGGDDYTFSVEVGVPPDLDATSSGTKLGRGASFRCIMSGTPMSADHVRNEFQAKRSSSRLMAIVAEGDQERLYLSPTDNHEATARNAHPHWKPDVEMNPESTDLLSGRGYGFTHWHELFTSRQLAALATLSDLLEEVRERVKSDYLGSAEPQVADGTHVFAAESYANAVTVYLSFCLDKATLTNTTQATWQKNPDRLTQAFGRQAIPMIWDYAEANPLSEAGGGFGITPNAVAKVLDRLPTNSVPGRADQGDATSVRMNTPVVSTDPPYYDNISYADLSDYFYVWLRRPLRHIFPDLFSTVSVPKSDELIAARHRHDTRASAEAFFLEGMTLAMRRLAEQAHEAFPVTVYYAFRQSESEQESVPVSTGWETFLAALMKAGFTITGTWPVRSELTGNLKKSLNALATSIVLVCRPRIAVDALSATRREFQDALRAELPVALRHLQRGNIAPVDLAQASLGPGMAVFTRYREVLNADGTKMSVRDALTLINATLGEVLAEQEGDFDSDSRWAVTWFEQFGYTEGEYGTAEQLSKSKNTSVEGLVRAGIVESRRGKVRIFKPSELDPEWDPAEDPRLTVWDMTHHLIRALESGGEGAAAAIASKLGSKAETARELAYRLYVVSERKKRAADALAYNGLVQSWPEIVRLAREQASALPVEQQAALGLDRA